MPVEEPSSALVQTIENNLLLKQALAELKVIKQQQDLNHLVSLQLRDHKTIERVDTLWTAMGEMKFLMRMVAGMLGFAFALVGGLYATHFIFGWP